MFYQVTEDSNHNKQLTCLAGQVPGNGCPLGSIMPYYGTTMPSRNWLLCDGSTFDADEYPALYEFLGSNTLPDLRGEFLRGAGTNGHSGQGNGGVVGQHQDATGIIQPFVNNNNYLAQVYGTEVTNADAIFRQSNYYKQISATNVATTNDQALVYTRPTNTSVNWIIKATSSIDTETSDNVYATIKNYCSPDWNNVITMTNPASPTVFPYTVPNDGWIILNDWISTSGSTVSTLYVNGIKVATSHQSYGSSGMITVNKNDIVNVTDIGSRSSTVLQFIPHK